jgi:uncharacterized membrane protein YczE
MNKIIGIIMKMTSGFFLCACGTVMALNSNLGLSPWDVLHQGLTNVTSLTIGQASIIVGVLIVIITTILGLKVGLGTIANMLGIGCFIDFIMYINFIPVCNNLFTGIIMMILSMLVSAIGSYLYIGCEMGCGPRDGLMIALMKITGKPVGIIRSCLEVSALASGWMLGGFVGIGTVITALGIGYCVQVVYKIFKFDVNSLRHKNIKQGFIFMNKCITNPNN